MKIIKNIQIILLTGLLLLLGACNENDFLDRYPKGTPSPDNFFVDATSARMAVNACYQPWQWWGGSYTEDMNYFYMPGVLDAMTDDSYLRGSGDRLLLESWNISPINDFVYRWWSSIYECINAANFAIENIPNSSDLNFTPEEQAPYIAEAKFFRAYSYLFLTTFYGDIPLFTKPASDFTDFYSPRSSKAEVLAQVVEDFKYAKDYLPAIQDDKGPPVKAAGAAFLAKTYLIMKEWALAEAAAREAVQIAEGSGHHLMDNYLDIWSKEGNPELLFYWTYIPDDIDHSQVVTVSRLCRDLPAVLKVAINGDGWGIAPLPQRDLYDAFEEGDPRREYTIYSPGHDYEIYPGPEDYTYTHRIYNEAGERISLPATTYKSGDMVMYDYRWSPTGMNVRKMTKSLKDVSNVMMSGMDIPVIRLGEVYLILAEALAEQEKSEALDWVNKVRARTSVNMPPKTAADGSLVDIVRHERRVELACESLRLFDLIRWGTLSEVFGNGEKVKRHFFSDYLSESSSNRYDSPIGNLSADPIFPTPQQELDRNPEINTQIGDWQQ